MMFEHVRKEQPFRLLGRGIILGGNEMCHFAKSIHHHHDGKLTMKSMDTLSHGPSAISNGCNNPACFLLSVQFCWQVMHPLQFTYSSTSFSKLGK
jgi:hypothetical protein